MPTVPQLVIQIGGNVDQTVTLTAQVTTIGRTPDNEIALPNPIISRRHAEIRLEPDGVTLTDVGSVYGTFMGEERLLPERPYRLSAGTEFIIGPYIITYREVEEEAAAEPIETGDTDGYADIETVAETPAVLTPPHSSIPSTPPHEAVPVPPPPTKTSSYIDILPVPLQDSNFLQRFLLIFESIWEPLEQRQDAIEMYFDSKTCPTSFLPWLASWIDVPIDNLWLEDRVRRVLGEAAELYRWQGTRYGLERMLEVQAGVHARVIENPAQPHVVRIVISIQDGDPVDINDISAIIETHKPAHVGYTLDVERA